MHASSDKPWQVNQMKLKISLKQTHFSLFAFAECLSLVLSFSFWMSACFYGAVNVAVLLSCAKFNTGKYTERFTCNFSRSENLQGANQGNLS